MITKSEKGTNGFGYDAIFMPNGFDKTMAELSSEEKNKCSHRYYAIKQLVFKLNFYLGLSTHEAYLKNLVKELYGEELQELSAFPGGMSNNTYLMTLSSSKKVVRFPGDCAEIFVDRNTEFNALEKVKGLTSFVQVDYFDHETGVKISPFVENSGEVDKKALIKTLDEFHNLPRLHCIHSI